MPHLSHPFISELQILRDLEVREEDKIRRFPFQDGKIRLPLVVFMKLNGAQDSGEVILRIYGKERKLQHEKIFTFGEDGKYYEYVILWNRIEQLRGREFYLTAFYGDELIYSRPFTLHRDKPEPDNH